MEEVSQEMKKGETNILLNEDTYNVFLQFFFKIATKKSLIAEKNGKS